MIHVFASEMYTFSAVEHYCHSLNSLLRWISNNEVKIRPSPSLLSSGIAAVQIDNQIHSDSVTNCSSHSGEMKVKVKHIF